MPEVCPFTARRLLEPACGTGRLVVELAGRGYRVAGFDRTRRRWRTCGGGWPGGGFAARIFPADMAGFRLGRPVDAAYCPFHTFRHLLTDEAARRHLECVAASLRPGGIYILGLHLLPPDAAEEDGERWTARRGQTQVTVTLRVLEPTAAGGSRSSALASWSAAGEKGDRLRGMSAAPPRVPLPHVHGRSIPPAAGRCARLELCDVYDFWYEIGHPLELNDRMADTVFILRKRLGTAQARRPTRGVDETLIGVAEQGKRDAEHGAVFPFRA